MHRRRLTILVIFVLAAILTAIAGCDRVSGKSTEGLDTNSYRVDSSAAPVTVVAVLVDVNGDGRLDLIGVSAETEPIAITQVLLGDGSGRFVDDTASGTISALGAEVSVAIRARLDTGAQPPAGIERIQVSEDGMMGTVYLVFG